MHVTCADRKVGSLPIRLLPMSSCIFSVNSSAVHSLASISDEIFRLLSLILFQIRFDFTASTFRRSLNIGMFLSGDMPNMSCMWCYKISKKVFSREVWLSGRSGNSCLLQEICFCNSCVPGISVSYNFDSFWKQCEHRNWFPICIMSLPIWSPISVIYLRFTWCWALSYLQSCYWNVTYTNAMLYTMSYNYPFISIVGEYHGLYWPALQYCSDNFLQAGSAIREKDLLVSSVVLKANPFWSHKATMAVHIRYCQDRSGALHPRFFQPETSCPLWTKALL